MLNDDNIICPLCSHSHEPTGEHEEDNGRWECHRCLQPFEVLVEYSAMYSTTKMEGKNNG